MPVVSAFYHVASSNHAELAQPEIEAIDAYLPAARHDAINLLSAFNRSCDPKSKTGLTFPSHLSPYGFPGAIGGSPNGDLRMRWEGIWALSAHIWDWEYTRNVTTLRKKTWPLATGLAEMWRKQFFIHSALSYTHYFLAMYSNIFLRALVMSRLLAGARAQSRLARWLPARRHGEPTTNRSPRPIVIRAAVVLIAEYLGCACSKVLPNLTRESVVCTCL